MIDDFESSEERKEKLSALPPKQPSYPEGPHCPDEQDHKFALSRKPLENWDAQPSSISRSPT
jgi:hypothetical protein